MSAKMTGVHWAYRKLHLEGIVGMDTGALCFNLGFVFRFCEPHMGLKVGFSFWCFSIMLETYWCNCPPIPAEIMNAVVINLDKREKPQSPTEGNTGE